MASKDYHELHSRLFEGMSRFFSGKTVVIMIGKNRRRRSVANAELWSDALTRYGRLLHSVSLLHLSELDFWNDMCRKVFGMQQTVYQNLPDPTTIASELSVHDSLPRLIL